MFKDVDMLEKYREVILDDSHKNSKEEKLIVFDGIVDEEAFKNVEVIFLLKEAVEKSLRDGYEAEITENSDFDIVDLRVVAKKEAMEQFNKKAKHWKALCYWISVYEEVDCSFNDVIESCGGNLAKVSIVNIKKVAGPAGTNPEVLNRIVSNKIYKSLIREQIEDIAPRIVICCGTFEQAKMIYDVQNLEVKQLDCGVSYFEHTCKNRDIKFLDFIHPSMRMVRDAMKFAFAKEVFRELKTQNFGRM